MKFFLACGVWLVLAILLGTGIVLAVGGSYVLLILTLALFVLGGSVFGYRQH